MARQVAAEESTTLPEGAVVKLERVRSVASPTKDNPLGSASAFRTELSAHHDNNTVRMTVANVSPHNLRCMLDMIVRQLAHERSKLVAEMREKGIKEVVPVKDPATWQDFVKNMMHSKMFIGQPLEAAKS